MKKRWGLPWLLMVAVPLSGCMNFGTDTDKRPPVVQQEEMPQYKVDQVRLETIESFGRVYVSYIQTGTREYGFSQQEILGKVYVKRGQQVYAGELLATKKGYEEAEAIVADAESAIKRLERELTSLQDAMNLELQELDIYMKYGAISATDYAAKTADIHKKYDRDIEKCSDELTEWKTSLTQAKATMKNGAIYAYTSGRVDWVRNVYKRKDKSDDEMDPFNTVKAGEKVVSIASGEPVFRGETEYASYFEEGEEITFTSGDASYVCEVSKVKDNVVTFRPLAVDDSVYVGMQLNYLLMLERHEAVPVVAKTALHTTGDYYYVYVVGEDNLRRMQKVEIGISDTKQVEIVSGLSVGDLVVTR